MSVHIVVQREDPVPVEAQDIVEPLLGSSIPAATERGRVFLSEEGCGEQPVEYTTLFRQGLALGQIIQIKDSILGLDFKGKLIGIKHTITRGGANEPFQLMTTLTIKKSSTFQVVSL